MTKKSLGVRSEPLIESGMTISNCVDTLITETNFERLIDSANRGDRAAAKELLALASAYLGSDLFGPMPIELRRYLCKAFVDASLGKSSLDVALNLKKSGRPPREHRNELRIGQWIRTRMQNGETLEKVSFDLASYIADGLRKYETFYGFDSIPDSKTLEGIYAKVLPELCSMEQVASSKIP